ncbi:hypothetical protein [Yinghuangia seranimata]|uniref:hypothetical protein n=1 Tax=Yinghuangia seranimata TaxID=408067 RepID=UPI00248C06DC|nr:hypothetical protein [Yinghuangia seranimata]MDI2130561.1 hypothetical protein [Yinghuangia seranimata]
MLCPARDAGPDRPDVTSADVPCPSLQPTPVACALDAQHDVPHLRLVVERVGMRWPVCRAAVAAKWFKVFRGATSIEVESLVRGQFVETHRFTGALCSGNFEILAYGDGRLHHVHLMKTPTAPYRTPRPDALAGAFAAELRSSPVAVVLASFRRFLDVCRSRLARRLWHTLVLRVRRAVQRAIRVRGAGTRHHLSHTPPRAGRPTGAATRHAPPARALARHVVVVTTGSAPSAYEFAA